MFLFSFSNLSNKFHILQGQKYKFLLNNTTVTYSVSYSKCILLYTVSDFFCTFFTYLTICQVNASYIIYPYVGQITDHRLDYLLVQQSSESSPELRSQIMSRAELFSVKKICCIINIQEKICFFYWVQNYYDIYRHTIFLSILFDILGPSDIFLMEISVISAN